jgi:hypothetical protein
MLACTQLIDFVQKQNGKESMIFWHGMSYEDIKLWITQSHFKNQKK